MKDINKWLILLALIVGIAIGLLIQEYIFHEPGHHVAVEDKQNDQSGHDESGKSIVSFNAKELQEFGIETAVAGSGKIVTHIDLPGEIKVDPERLAHISPRFPGIVKEVRKRIGDTVKEGEALAIIESNESLTSYEMKSLINGTVIDMHIAVGEMIGGETHAYQIADLSQVWARVSVYQKDLPKIHLRQPVIISAGPGVRNTSGKISYLSPTVDEQTRTATARVILSNKEGIWRPGMFVSVRVQTGEIGADIAVQRTALQTIEDQICVFVETEEGFKAQPVFIGHVNDAIAEITSGLISGQRYVTKGSYALKAEIMKGVFGEGHAH
jgi:cobalt-zinc-cadmium efflux system membrane fusion protein